MSNRISYLDMGRSNWETAVGLNNTSVQNCWFQIVFACRDNHTP